MTLYLAYSVQEIPTGKQITVCRTIKSHIRSIDSEPEVTPQLYEKDTKYFSSTIVHTVEDDGHAHSRPTIIADATAHKRGSSVGCDSTSRNKNLSLLL